MKLIREFGLGSLMVKLPDTCLYHHIDKRSGQVVILSEERMQLLIESVVRGSRGLSKRELIGMSFVGLASRFLSKEDVQYILDAFGYYSELVIMNAYDAIHLLGGLGPGNDFGGLKGGLYQIIDKLMDRIGRRAGSRILCNKTVVDIQYVYKGAGAGTGTRASGPGCQHNGGSVIEVYCKENKRPYVGLKCICALPKQVAENLAIFRGIRGMFSQIVCAPLCRIYSTFPVVRGKTWFSDMPKFTTTNNLRMVIPISESDGVIMISYSDNKYADGWNRLYKSEGVDAVNRELARLMKKSTGIDIPTPLSTQVFHWPCGVGYWGVGAESSQFPLQPDLDVPIYLCGEHYSGEYQQWMEGALETAKRVVEKIWG
jgi:hypothetical protein